MQIRILNGEDASLYQLIRLEALQENPEAFASSYEEESEYTLERFRKRLDDETSITLGMFDGNELLGVVSFVREQRRKIQHRATIYAMYVRPEYRGKGLAKQLMKEVLHSLEDFNEIQQVYLSVVSSNHRAKKLYQSFGFQTYGVDTNALIVDGVYYDEELMMKNVLKPHIQLIKPTVKLEKEYLSFYKDWVMSKEDMIPWVIEKDPSDFEAMVDFLLNNEKGINLKEGWVPDSTYWLVNENKRILGVVNIRHQLTDFLLKSGGHIGYGIRPSERKKGYATKLLELSLEKAKELGIQKVLIVCDADNHGSLKVIQNNGGIPDVDYVEEDGNIVKRFWINNN